MGSTYSKDSMQHLPPREFVRSKPGIYCGDTEYSTQLLIEIFSNSVDEARAGHAKTIAVEIKGNTITVTDDGQGFIPDLKSSKGRTWFEDAFSLFNTSGKFNEKGVYDGVSLGTYGIGAKLATYLSHTLVATTYRDGKQEKIEFADGIINNREITKVEKGIHGTQVTWTPDSQFFDKVNVDLKVIRSLFETTACLCPQLMITLVVDGKREEFYSDNGLSDLVDKLNLNEITPERLNISVADNKFELDLVMTYDSSYSSTIVSYVNTGLTDSGPHITQIKTTITREMNKFFKAKGWLKESDTNLTGEDIQEGMYIVFNYVAPSIGYDAQIKSRVVKIDTKFLSSVFAEKLKDWMEENSTHLQGIVDKALGARNARLAAKKAREEVRETPKVKASNKFDLVLPGKLTDCSSKDRSKCEVFIVEGDSAAGSGKSARDRKTQAVLAVRGKILNVQRASLEKIMGNAEIRTMITAFGLQTDLKTGKVTVDEKKLRYGKIIVMTDADVDGAHIQVLFLTFVYNFAPELISKGYVYISQPPLFRITKNKQYTYLRDDAALAEYKKTAKGSYEVGRMKGLGEMDAKELKDTVMDPGLRTLKQITMTDLAAAKDMFDSLMGTDVKARKSFIVDNAWKVEV